MLNLIFKESGRTKVRMIMEPDSDVGLVAAKVVKEGKSDLSRRCILTTSVGRTPGSFLSVMLSCVTMSSNRYLVLTFMKKLGDLVDLVVEKERRFALYILRLLWFAL